MLATPKCMSRVKNPPDAPEKKVCKSQTQNLTVEQIERNKKRQEAFLRNLQDAQNNTPNKNY